jgi:hypothetical protein
MKEMAFRLNDWALGHKVWDDLCQKGELYSIERVENETGISKNDLIRRLRYGLEIKNHQNRIQHLCNIPPDYVGARAPTH